MTVPAFDAQSEQLSAWALSFLKLVGREATRAHINQAVEALRVSLADIEQATEAALLQEAYDAAQALEQHKATWRRVTPQTYGAWQCKWLRLQAVRWWTCVKLEAKRMGW